MPTSLPALPPAPTRLGDYLIGRLRDLGVGHVFGVPGDFVLTLFGKLAASDLVVVNTCDEQGAGFAADAYARTRGLGVVCVIYGLADPVCRPLVLVGDGAFQMTGLELSTAVRFGLAAVVVLLNNAGYTTEHLMLDGPFNDVLPWRHHRLPELLGAGRAFLVATEDDLDRALAATAETETYCLLDVTLDPRDVSPALRCLTDRLGSAARAEAEE